MALLVVWIAACATTAPRSTPRVPRSTPRSRSYLPREGGHQSLVDAIKARATAGNAAAQMLLGRWSEVGHEGVSTDLHAALQWYRKAAEQGNAAAENDLGVLYQEGRGIAKDEAAAATWYRKAAEQGLAAAQTNLARLYEEGRGLPVDPSAAATWYRKAAEQGLAAAQTNLARLYEEGRGLPVDPSAAATWYRKAAEQGDPVAQSSLGAAYLQGRGVRQDDSQAVAWIRKAASQGEAAAKNNLALLYREGRQVQQSDSSALKLFTQAAEHGNPWGKRNLARMHEEGRGVVQDPLKAARLYYEAGQGFLHQHRMAEAESAARAIDRLFPDFKLARQLRAEIAAGGGAVVLADQPALQADPEIARLQEKIAAQRRKVEEAKRAQLHEVERKRAITKLEAELARLQGLVGERIDAGPTALTRDLLDRLPRRAEKRHGVAVIIGNRDYHTHHPDVPDVAYAHNDAQAMKAYVVRTLGYRERDVLYVEDATQAQMVSLFGTRERPKGRLARKVGVTPSDLFIYYSGHGAPGLSDHRGYLLPVNTDPATLEINGYPLETLYTNLAQLPSHSVTVVIDACFSGSSARGPVIRGASDLVIRARDPRARLPGGTVITAADATQVASWDDQAHLGLFTRQFLEGVAGRADEESFGNGDGRVTLGELRHYLQTQVPYAAGERFGRDQEPQVSGDMERVMAVVGR